MRQLNLLVLVRLAGIEGGPSSRNVKKERRTESASSESGSDDDSGSDSGTGAGSGGSGTESEAGRARRRSKRQQQKLRRPLEGKMRSDTIRCKKEEDEAGEDGGDTPRDAERWEHDKFNEMDRVQKADRDAASFGAHWSKIKSEKVRIIRRYLLHKNSVQKRDLITRNVVYRGDAFYLVNY